MHMEQYVSGAAENTFQVVKKIADYAYFVMFFAKLSN